MGPACVGASGKAGGRQGLSTWQRESRGAVGVPGGKPRTRLSWAEGLTSASRPKCRRESRCEGQRGKLCFPGKSQHQGLERPRKEFPDGSSVPLTSGGARVGVPASAGCGHGDGDGRFCWEATQVTRKCPLNS